MTNIADEIRAEMARQKMTAMSLAARSGIKPQTLARKLRGDREFNFREVEGVAHALGMPMWRLVAAAEKRTPTDGYAIQDAKTGTVILEARHVDIGSAA